ncbi:MAG: hypothetical protein GY757_55775, partial [bacterium]|nr:hypothetical protein [bacterium]
GVNYWRGDIKTASKVVLGHMILVRISSFLRQAVVEMDKVEQAAWPTSDKIGSLWQEVFKKAYWDVKIDISDPKIEEPPDSSWSNAELHKMMLKYRNSTKFDKQWRYHLLAVKKLDDGAFGVMYDNTINGLNDIPREGAAVAFEEKVTGHDWWGKCKGKTIGEIKETYIRTAIHEIGHAMMLYHPENTYENYMMQKTVHIARNAVPPLEFPENLEWAFSPRNIFLLCHLPDIAIRPGGVSFGTPHRRLPISIRDEVTDVEGLTLGVSPLEGLDVVPYGAPIRINFSLKNCSEIPKLVPGSLSMKTGHLSGKVIDPLGTLQEFATIIKYTRDFRLQELQPGETIQHSVTLLWGTNGPLFPTCGHYRIIIDLTWDLEGTEVNVSGFTSIMVLAPKDEDQARAALKIFSTPESLLTLAIGGDHIETGNRAFHAALHNKELKPHFSLVEAKRLGQRFYDRAPNLKETAKLIDKKTIMSRAEVIRLAKIVAYFAKETDKKVLEKMLDVILFNAKKMGVEDNVRKVLSNSDVLEILTEG